MYQIIEESGDIIFPDGFVLSVPYQDENNRYQEYAAWVHNGNQPEVI